MTNNKEIDVKLFYVDYDKIKDLSINNQVDYFLDKIEKGFVIIVDSALDPIVLMKLTEKILSKVNENPLFKGIECITIEKNEKRGFINNLFSKIIKKNEGITLIGPSNIIKKMEREGNLIHMKI
jgi:hypothetical protein